MPVWHEKTKTLRDEGKLELVSIVPEQHGERTRLFMQWKRLSWPTLVDPLNLLGVPYVPISLALDEHGVIRLVQPLFASPDELLAFVSAEYDPPQARAEAGAPASASRSDGPSGWRSRGDRLFQSGRPGELGRAIEAYERAVTLDDDDPVTWFRLGVAFRARYDSGGRRPGDFQRAVESWSRSLEIDPNNYIVRRRLQQYGPRLDKPYPFYEWVHDARKEIAARGETPRRLTVEPAGSELAGRLRSFPEPGRSEAEPDPEGLVKRDGKKLITVEPTVVPWPAKAGEPVRVHLVFRPNEAVDARWNNEVGALRVWLEPPEGWSIDARLLEHAPGEGATSTETRRIETELRAPDAAPQRAASLGGHALYYVCEGAAGRCLYRRQDISVPLVNGSEGGE